MYYHASQVKDIKILEPRSSYHDVPLVYFSKKRENVLIYLCNAVERYCKETNFEYNGIWKKWATYGFDKDGRQHIEEYYPKYLEKTYKGISGYIYSNDSIIEADLQIQIPDVCASFEPVKVMSVEYVEDVYDAILEAEEKGLITITRYEELTGEIIERNKKMILKEYKQASNHPEYRHFIRGNFPEYIMKY